MTDVLPLVKFGPEVTRGGKMGELVAGNGAVLEGAKVVTADTLGATLAE